MGGEGDEKPSIGQRITGGVKEIFGAANEKQEKDNTKNLEQKIV